MLLFNQNESPSAAFQRGMERITRLAVDIERIHSGVSPADIAGSDVPILDRWIVGQRLIPCLAGLSTGHPLLPGENRMIGTTDLWLLSEDRTWARTLSRWYRLGRPAEISGLDS